MTHHESRINKNATKIEYIFFKWQNFGRFVLGLFVHWVIFCLGSLGGVSHFVPWVVLSLGRFELGSFFSLRTF